MDKNKVTILIIALAVVLVLFLLYRYGKAKVDTAGKLDDAAADLEIKKQQDAYITEKEDAYRDRTVKEVTEGSYEDAYQQTTIAEGYTTLAEYRNSLTEGEKVEYDNDRTRYIEVMGKDPGLMSLDQLRDWYKTYLRWEGLNDQYIELTGESKSFLDPEFDSVSEMKAAIQNAKAEIELAEQQAENEWQETYIQLNKGTDDLRPFDGFTAGELKQYCPTTAKLTAFHNYLNSLSLAWEIERRPALDNYMKNVLYPAIVNDLKWTTAAKNNVDWINGFDAEICKTVANMDPQSQLYLMSLYNNGSYKAVNQYTRVNSTRDPHDAKTLYTMTAAMRNRLTVSEITYSPIDATAIEQVQSYKLTYDKPKHCGSDRSELVTSGKVNQNAANLLDMILSLESTAKAYSMTYYGVAKNNQTGNIGLLAEWSNQSINY